MTTNDRKPLLTRHRICRRRTGILEFIYEPVRDEASRVTGIFCKDHDVADAHLARAVINARYTSVLAAMGLP